ncbi:MAG TPA: isoprenylcysteine carboxylmethyltransferase family protein [Bauldia sp.]|nr:isoprenylcysteine carboxylmethyltransferase family protein [Bauldia sp.]
MADFFLGPAQIAGIILVVQRIAEEIYSQINTRRLLAMGAHEEGREFIRVVLAVHVTWLAGFFLIIPPTAQPIWPLIILYILIQPVRYWIIATLGRYWTHGIVTLDGAPIVRTGPYRYVRHPNYIVTVIELFLLPAAFGAWGMAVIYLCLWLPVVRYKIILEDRAIAARRQQAAA